MSQKSELDWTYDELMAMKTVPLDLMALVKFCPEGFDVHGRTREEWINEPMGHDHPCMMLQESKVHRASCVSKKNPNGGVDGYLILYVRELNLDKLSSACKPQMLFCDIDEEYYTLRVITELHGYKFETPISEEVVLVDDPSNRAAFKHLKVIFEENVGKTVDTVTDIVLSLSATDEGANSKELIMSHLDDAKKLHEL